MLNERTIMSNNSWNATYTDVNTYQQGISAIPISFLGALFSVISLYQTWSKPDKSRRFFPTTLLFTNVAVSSFSFAMLGLPVIAHTMSNGSGNFFSNPDHSGICQTAAFLYFVTLTACAFSHSSIALNRLFAVILAKNFPSLKSTKFSVVLIADSWIFAFLIFIFPFFGVFGRYGFSSLEHRCTFLSLHPGYLYTYKVLTIFVPLGVMAICYGTISWFEFTSKRRFIVSSPTKPNTQTAPFSRKCLQELHAAHISFWTCSAFVVCFVPYAIYGVTVKNISGLQSRIGTGIAVWVWIGKYTQKTDWVCTTLTRKLRAYV